jgi:hypothetical protein
MELNNNDAAAGAESIHVQPGLTSEIDLYAELVAFAKLSPEEQSRLGNHPVPASEPEGIVNSAPIETIEAESIPAETEETSAELVAKNNPPESVAIHLPEVQPESGMRDTADWTGSGEIVDAAKDVSTKEPVSTAKASSSTLDDRCSPAVTRPDPGGPLSALNLSQEIVFTGAMSRGVCLACGAESDADDLFCLTCGGFIDDVAPTPPSTPLCKVCKHRIDPDEIFCPWCGSSASA